MIGTEEAWALDGAARASSPCVGAGASGAEIASAYGRLGAEVLLFEALDRVLPTEDADISKVAGRGARQAEHQGPHRHARRERRRRTTTRSRSPSATRPARSSGSSSPPAAGRTSRRSGSTTAGVKLDDSGLIEVDGALRTSRQEGLRDRRPRPRPRARAQGVRRGRHRRRGRGRAWRPTRSSTSTSRARRSARPTSPRSG